MKVRRVLIIEGNEEWVKATLGKSISGIMPIGNGKTIAEVSREIFGEDQTWKPLPPERESRRFMACDHTKDETEGL